MKWKDDYHLLKAVLESYVPEEVEAPYINKAKESMDSLFVTSRLISLIATSSIWYYLYIRKNIWHGRRPLLNHYSKVFYTAGIIVLIWQMPEICYAMKGTEMLQEMSQTKFPISSFIASKQMEGQAQNKEKS
ncbi:unnamed protein product [Blepharisma stoltei]|uniref:Uncharacterized protein n=1 Tax=Blepharisma stoltei TaxID=1481888 RepID=A0AAU9IQ52_9CILI|nr:unnamed protein product [Blepharisma stoltei]